MATPGLDRLVKEHSLARPIAKELQRQQRAVIAEARKDLPDFELLWADFEERTTAALIVPLVAIYDQAVGEVFGDELSIKQDLLGGLLSLAQTFARAQGKEIARAITNTTRIVVTKAFATVTSTPGMTMADFKDLVGRAFSLERIQKIAITETTRARFEGVREAQAELKKLGFRTELVWFTQADERVCPICGPLHGVAEQAPGSGVWEGGYSPPAHIGCRCKTRSRAV